MTKEIQPTKKNCFWRHGPFKTVKIVEHDYDGKIDMSKIGGKDMIVRFSSEFRPYKTKRILTIQQCRTCGKLIVHNSCNSMRG